MVNDTRVARFVVAANPCLECPGGGNLVDRKWWTHYYGRRTIVANASHLRNVKRETRGESWGGRRFFRQFRRPKDSLFVGPRPARSFR